MYTLVFASAGALDRIRPAAEAVVSRLRNLSQPADEVGVEFGIKLNAKIGAIIASADAEATYKVRLRWRSGISEAHGTSG